MHSDLLSERQAQTYLLIFITQIDQQVQSSSRSSRTAHAAGYAVIELFSLAGSDSVQLALLTAALRYRSISSWRMSHLSLCRF